MNGSGIEFFVQKIYLNYRIQNLPRFAKSEVIYLKKQACQVSCRWRYLYPRPSYNSCSSMIILTCKARVEFLQVVK